MRSLTYSKRRRQLEAYFDRSAREAWARLTSEAPLNRIRATVRRGREEMQSTLLGMLPSDLSGRRVLDAGCGTGTLSVELARRGADVVGIDLSPNLINLARKRAENVEEGSIELLVGDMLSLDLGTFDHVVAMDSLIHYRESDMVEMVSALCTRAREKVVITFAPRTPLLTLMHFLGRFFPRGDRSPAIEPIAETRLRRRLRRHPALSGWTSARSRRIHAGFYISQALEVTRP